MAADVFLSFGNAEIVDVKSESDYKDDPVMQRLEAMITLSVISQLSFV